MKSIGFVSDIKRKDSKQILTLVLNYDELKTHKLVLGEFMVVVAGGTRRFLARVEDCYYASVTVRDDEKNKALATGRLNGEMDQSSVKYINFMHYDLALLGELSVTGNQFYAGMREVPALMDMEIFRPDQAELQKIVAAKVPGGSEEEKPFNLGVLQYGTKEDASGCPTQPPFSVKISFNVANLLKKRTAVFGKTGYGKSNLVKTLITLAHVSSPTTSQLIFDVNGEYAFSNKQGPGLIEIFKQERRSEKIVVYSNREDAQKEYGNEAVKPIKFDVIENPELAVALVIGKRLQRERNAADYLDALTDPDMHDTIRAFWKCFCVKELGLTAGSHHKANYEAPTKYVKDKQLDDTKKHIIDDFDEAYDAIVKYSTSDTVKNLKGKTGQFSFLQRLHYLGAKLKNGEQLPPCISFWEGLKSDLNAGKIVIIDLPSVDSSLLAPLSDRIAVDVFNKAQNSFLLNSVKQDDNSSNTQVLLYVEEAHNVLSNQQNTIFPRIAREGRKYGIGLVYSTQRPGSIDEDILTQTENFFVMHVGSKQDAMKLQEAKIAFASPISDFILTEPAVGVAYVYSEPYQPYVLSCKVKKFDDVLKVSNQFSE